MKNAMYARLRLTQPGPGTIHFPWRVDANYFRQLTVERGFTRFEQGRPIRSWQLKHDGKRNETFDTFFFAHAARHGLISMGLMLNEEVEEIACVPTGTSAQAARMIRSAWIRSTMSLLS